MYGDMQNITHSYEHKCIWNKNKFLNILDVGKQGLLAKEKRCYTVQLIIFEFFNNPPSISIIWSFTASKCFFYLFLQI